LKFVDGSEVENLSSFDILAIFTILYELNTDLITKSDTVIILDSCEPLISHLYLASTHLIDAALFDLITLCLGITEECCFDLAITSIYKIDFEKRARTFCIVPVFDWVFTADTCLDGPILCEGVKAADWSVSSIFIVVE